METTNSPAVEQNTEKTSELSFNTNGVNLRAQDSILYDTVLGKEPFVW